ncbi:MAG: DUF1638 domain-containing protein [Candidatus Methanoplasma sp.]|jgi:hypothetical protein|nr:DUF1638 domain-containing protein [Candidatus Methanoplasma sp.]
MARGTMGIIGCPVLEDEIVYALESDPDEKRIYLVESAPARTLAAKLDRRGIAYEPVGEWEFGKGYAPQGMGDGFNVVVMMNKLGLHSRPAFLKETIEEQLRFHHGRFGSIALYYGMCGNAGWDVSEWASRELGARVSVFRGEDGSVCDDCIGVAVGSHPRYCEFVKKHPGMFYVTPCIAGNWKEYSEELDFCKGFEIMGINTVKEVFQVYGYKKAVKIDTGLGVKGEELDRGCRLFSEETGLEMTEAEPGSVMRYPADRIYAEAKAALGG